MYIAGMYIDPIYIVIASMIVFIAVLLYVAHSVSKLRKVLELIHDASINTERNTRPIQRMSHDLFIQQISPNRSFDSDVTQRIPTVRQGPGQIVSGKLYLKGPDTPDPRINSAVDLRAGVPHEQSE